MSGPEGVLLPHGGYEHLRSYKVAEAVYDESRILHLTLVLHSVALTPCRPTATEGRPLQRRVQFVPLVPELYLGTRFSPKFHFVIPLPSAASARQPWP